MNELFLNIVISQEYRPIQRIVGWDGTILIYFIFTFQFRLCEEQRLAREKLEKEAKAAPMQLKPSDHDAGEKEREAAPLEFEPEPEPNIQCDPGSMPTADRLD